MKRLAIQICAMGYCLIMTIGVSLGQPTPTELLNKISDFQVVNHDFYDPGLFPADRTWSFSQEAVDDNTIYFTAAITSSLRLLQSQMDSSDQQIAQQILEKALPVFSKYESRQDLPSYNFWQTVPPDLPFPNGSKLLSNESLRLPDDIETSTLVALARNDQNHSQKLKKYMLEYSSRSTRGDVKLYTLDEYQNSKAYECWFGKNMPQAFDINAISNVLLHTFVNRYPLNFYDSASIDLIVQFVQNDDHLENLGAISLHTSSTALVLYHLSRLTAYDDQGFFKEIETDVLNDLYVEEQQVENEIERCMIHASIYRLGGQPKTEVDWQKLENHSMSFLSMYINPFNISKGLNPFLPSITWVCEAYNWMFVLESEILRNHYGKKSHPSGR